MTTLVLDKDPVAVDVRFSTRHLTIDLADGRGGVITLPWYRRLLNASRTERLNCRLLGGGYAIEWPDLDEHIGVEGLLAGHPSGESAHSLNRWLAARAKKKKTSVMPKALKQQKEQS